MRVLLTGASGLVGRQALSALLAAGASVHALGRRPPEKASSGLQFRFCDLLDEASTAAAVASIRPTHLLHCAWFIEPGSVWWHEDNLRWVSATLGLFRHFAAAGGTRAVLVGTCAEYDWSDGWCGEDVTPLRPATLYGTAKHATHLALASFARRVGVSLCWARLFNMYGPHEDERRLVAGAFAALLAGREFPSTDGEQLRDFMHVQDVGAGLAFLLAGTLEGPLNLASGAPITIRALLEEVGRVTGRAELLRLGTRPRPEGDPERVLADVSRLSATGWQPRFGLEDGVADTMAWWQNRRAEPGGRGESSKGANYCP